MKRIAPPISLLLRLVVGALAGLVTFVPAASAALLDLNLPNSLVAAVAPAEDLTLAGRLQIGDPEGLQASIVPLQVPGLAVPAAAALPFYEAAYTSIGVEEWHWATVGGKDQVIHHIYDATGFEDVAISLVALHAAPEWLVVSGRHVDGNAYEAAGIECSVRPGSKPPLVLDQRRLQSFEDPWKNVPELLEARCTTGELEMDGRNAYFLAGTQIEVRGLNLESGRRETVRFDADSSHSLDPLGAGTVYHSVRVLSLRSQLSHRDFPASFDVEGRFRVRLITPALSAVGQLALPQSHGWLQWNEWHQNGFVDPLNASGAFVLSAGRGAPVSIHGRTTSGPRSDGAGQVLAPALTMSAAIAIATIGALVLWLRRMAGAGLALFAKLPRHKVLDHPARSQIHSLVQQDPGIALHEIAERLALRRSTVRHHLRLLEEHGIVASYALGRERVFFEAGGPRKLPDAALLSLRRPRAQDLMALRRARPHLGQRELAKELGISKSYVNRLLKELEAAGAIEPSAKAPGRRRRADPCG